MIKLPSVYGESLHKEYAKARKAGWRPLAGKELEDWERRLLIRSTHPVLRYGIGEAREVMESYGALTALAPIAADEAKVAVRDKISNTDSVSFAKLMDLYARCEGRIDADPVLRGEIHTIAKSLSKPAVTQIDGILARRTAKGGIFHIDNNERPYYRSTPDFRLDLDFQLRHDIKTSLDSLRWFIQRARE